MPSSYDRPGRLPCQVVASRLAGACRCRAVARGRGGLDVRREPLTSPTGVRHRLHLASVVSTVGLAWALLFAAAASAAWVEPVPGPVNQTNALAFGINGDGSTPFVGLFQFQPAPSSTSNITIQVSSPQQGSWNVSAPLNSSGSIGGASITGTRLPYVAWAEYRSGPTVTSEIHVVRYAGTS